VVLVTILSKVKGQTLIKFSKILGSTTS